MTISIKETGTKEERFQENTKSYKINLLQQAYMKDMP